MSWEVTYFSGNISQIVCLILISGLESSSMLPRDMRQYHAWFGRYTRTFRLPDLNDCEPIDLKIVHCQRVRKEIYNMGNDLGLSKHDLHLAALAGLFHDIGRFEQYRRFKTFIDSRSVDHGRLGVKILEQFRVLELLPRPDKEIILKAITYHNKRKMPEGESDRCLFFCRLLRDADKLDILRLFKDHLSSDKKLRNSVVCQGLPDTPGLSKSVLGSILNHEMVDYSHVINLNDYALMRASWVFDINFPPALKRIRERGHLAFIRSRLPDLKEVSIAFDVMEPYLDNRINNNPLF